MHHINKKLAKDSPSIFTRIIRSVMRTVLSIFDSGLVRSLATFHGRLLTKELSPVSSAAKEYHEMEEQNMKYLDDLEVNMPEIDSEEDPDELLD